MLVQRVRAREGGPLLAGSKVMQGFLFALRAHGGRDARGPRSWLEPVDSWIVYSRYICAAIFVSFQTRDHSIPPPWLSRPVSVEDQLAKTFGLASEHKLFRVGSRFRRN